MSYECQLDLVTIRGSLNGDKYTREVPRPIVMSYFDNGLLAASPGFIDGNAKPHRSREITAFL